VHDLSEGLTAATQVAVAGAGMTVAASRTPEVWGH